MSKEEAQQRFEQVLKDYERGAYTPGGASLHIFECTALLDPEYVVKMLPPTLLEDMWEVASRPLLERKDYSSFTGGTFYYPPGTDMKAVRRRAKERENREYEGLRRLHTYLNQT